MWWLTTGALCLWNLTSNYGHILLKILLEMFAFITMCHSVCPRKAEIAYFRCFIFQHKRAALQHCSFPVGPTLLYFAFKYAVYLFQMDQSVENCTKEDPGYLSITWHLFPMLVLKTVPSDEHSYIYICFIVSRCYTHHPVSRR